MTLCTDGKLRDGRDAFDATVLFSHLIAQDMLDAPLSGELRVGLVHLYVRKITEASGRIVVAFRIRRDGCFGNFQGGVHFGPSIPTARAVERL